MTIFGIDISNHQRDFDVARAVREGYQFVFAKCCEGTGYNDPYFFQNVARTRAAGAVPGAYHWLKYGAGAAQARKLYDRCMQAGIDDLVVTCDNEDNADWPTTVEFFNEWKRLTGGKPMMMYSGGWWWAARGWNGAALTPYLWTSRYVSGSGYGGTLYANTPSSFWYPGYGGWPKATVLQFSSSGVVAGQRIDVNAFEGSLGQLKALAGGKNMDWADRDIYADASGPNMTYAGMLRDTAFTLLYGKAGVAHPEGVIARLQRLEDAQGGSRTEILQRIEAAKVELQEAIGDGNQLVLDGPQMERLSNELRSAFNDWAGGLETGLANQVASILAPQFRQLGQIAEQLGRMGDFMGQNMGTLNDPPQQG